MTTFTGTTGADVANAQTGTITGFTGGSVALLQDALDDTFICGAGGDSVVAGIGDDDLRGLAGNDTLNGGAGNDEARYDRDAAAGGGLAVTVNLATGVATDGFGNTDTLINIEIVRGTALADTFIGGGAGNGTATIGNLDGFESFRGLAGNDTINGGGGFDEVSFHQDASNGGTAGVTVNLVLGTAVDGFGNTDTLTSIEGVRGTNAADTFIGNFQDNTFTGSGGNDTMDGGDGFDALRYDRDNGQGGTLGVTVNLQTGIAIDGFGNQDTVSNIEAVRGTQLVDTITGNDFVGFYGDYLQGLAGADILSGGTGYDYAIYSNDADFGGTGAINANLVAGTIVDGFGNVDTVSGIENVRGSNSADTFLGNAGNNTFEGLGGNDTLNGGSGGSDTANYDADVDNGGNGGVTVNLATGVATDGFGNSDTLINLDSVRGTIFADRLTGNNGNNVLTGGKGNDTINGGGGVLDEAVYTNDWRRGGDGAVNVNLGTGIAIDGFGNTDTLSGIEIVRGSRNGDTLTGSAASGEFFRGMKGNDTINGGGGIDFVSYSRDIFEREPGQPFNGVVVNLQTGQATDSWGGTDTLIAIANITGGSLGDQLIGTNASDNLFRGLAGNDTLNGGAGVDSDTADYSEDASYGALIFQNGNAAISVNLSTGTAVDGFGATDTLISIENVIGTDGGDTVVGTSGVNTIAGGAGNDTITGGAGSDILDGGLGIDLAAQGVTTASTTFKHTSQSTNGWTLTSGADTDTLANIERAQFTDGTVTLRQAHSNFNFGATSNDVGATSDILLMNAGTLVNWTVQSNSVAAGALLGTGLTGWSVKATGDTNADGDADLILQNGGDIVAWNMQGGALASGALIGTGAVGWSVVGAADLNNDGDQDLILQNGGTIVAWNMQNGVLASGSLLASGATGWNVVGTGDFFGDGSSDILLQNGGNLVAWNVVNGAVAGGVLLGGGLTGWSVKATGDVNGDGQTDIILQNGGTIVDWTIANGVVTSGNVLGTGLTGWNVVASGDYNGDGTSDILLQNGGSIVTWDMLNGVVSGGVLTAGGATGWLVVG